VGVNLSRGGVNLQVTRVIKKKQRVSGSLWPESIAV